MARRGHGDDSIYKRSDGRWAIGMTLEGGKRKTFYGKTRKEVQEKLKAALYTRQKGMFVTEQQQKVEQFFVHWLEKVHKQSIRDRTYERYEEIIRLHLVPAIGHHQLQKLSAQHLQSFYTNKIEEGLSATTVIRFHKRLPGLWSYAVGHVDGGENGLADGWLRYVISTEDTNRLRWPVHPDWQVIQSAFAPVVLEESEYEREEREKEELLQLVDEELEAHPWKDTSRMVKCEPSGVSHTASVSVPPLLQDLGPFMRRRRYQVNLRRMVAQIAGCTITTEAWRPVDRLGGGEADLSDTFHFLYEEVESYLEEKKRNFNELVQKKRILYSVEKEQAIA